MEQLSASQPGLFTAISALGIITKSDLDPDQQTPTRCISKSPIHTVNRSFPGSFPTWWCNLASREQLICDPRRCKPFGCCRLSRPRTMKSSRSASTPRLGNFVAVPLESEDRSVVGAEQITLSARGRARTSQVMNSRLYGVRPVLCRVPGSSLSVARTGNRHLLPVSTLTVVPNLKGAQLRTSAKSLPKAIQ